MLKMIFEYEHMHFCLLSSVGKLTDILKQTGQTENLRIKKNFFSFFSRQLQKYIRIWYCLLQHTNIVEKPELF